MTDDSDKLDRFKEAFQRGEEGQVSDYQAWLRDQGFNPDRVTEDWITQYFRENPAKAANHDEQLEEVAEYLGFLSRNGGRYHLPVIGVSGIGKTLFLYTISHAVDQLEIDIPVMHLDAETFDDVTKDDRQRIRVVEEELREHDQVVVLVDNCRREREIVESLRSVGSAVDDGLVLGCWTPEWWRHYCEDVASVFPVSDEIHLEPLDDREMGETVESIFEAVSDGKVSAPDPFVSGVQEHSFGVPGTAVNIVLQALKKTFHGGMELGDPDSVEKAVDALGIRNVREAVYDLPESRLSILIQMLLDTDPRGMQPSKLVDLLNRDKSTVSYHLRELRSDNIVKSEKAGRMAFYRIREPVKPVVQARIIEEGEIHG